MTVPLRTRPLVDDVALLVAGLFPLVMLLRCQMNDVNVDRLSLLQLRRNRAEAVRHLITGHGNVLALDAKKEGLPLIRDELLILFKLKKKHS